MPLEILEHILRVYMTVEDFHCRYTLTTQTDLRWLSTHRSKVKLLSSMHGQSSNSCAFQFFSDVITFEKVMCRCGRAGVKPGPEGRKRHPISVGHHITFCNVSYLHLDFREMQGLSMEDVHLAFKCLRTLTELQVRCSDGDIGVSHMVASWTFHVPTMKTVRFESKRKSVSMSPPV